MMAFLVISKFRQKQDRLNMLNMESKRSQISALMTAMTSMETLTNKKKCLEYLVIMIKLRMHSYRVAPINRKLIKFLVISARNISSRRRKQLEGFLKFKIQPSTQG